MISWLQLEPDSSTLEERRREEITKHLQQVDIVFSVAGTTKEVYSILYISW